MGSYAVAVSQFFHFEVVVFGDAVTYRPAKIGEETVRDFTVIDDLSRYDGKEGQ